MKVSSGQCKRLLITMPPRHGKSELVSKYFPAWYLMSHPDERIILASYEAEFAASWGKKALTIVRKFAPQFGMSVRQNQQSGRHWGIEDHEGEMYTSGVGGPITGKGGNIILDDPIKNAEEAHSPRYREKTWEWFNSTLYTRLEPNAWIILIQTRWHEDDLAGRILDQERDKWTHINFPAIAEEEDILGRHPGDALWPMRFPIEELNNIKNQIGSYWFSSLYQQHPSPVSGSLFKQEWWKYYDNEINFDTVIQSWDMSFKSTKGGSYVVGQVWGKLGKNKYLIYQIRKQADFTETLDMVRHVSRKFPSTYKKFVEEKANGAAIMSALKKEIGGFYPVNPRESKEARASAVSPQVERGEVFLPRMEPFTEEFVYEHTCFPYGQNDDQVDACTQALSILETMGRRVSFGGNLGQTRTRKNRFNVSPQF